jgi:hypothetical protein
MVVDGDCSVRVAQHDGVSAAVEERESMAVRKVVTARPVAA